MINLVREYKTALDLLSPMPWNSRGLRGHSSMLVLECLGAARGMIGDLLFV